MARKKGESVHNGCSRSSGSADATYYTRLARASCLVIPALPASCPPMLRFFLPICLRLGFEVFRRGPGARTPGLAVCLCPGLAVCLCVGFGVLLVIPSCLLAKGQGDILRLPAVEETLPSPAEAPDWHPPVSLAGDWGDWTNLSQPRQDGDWQVLPQGLIYRSYLAGAKESRFRSVWHKDNGDGSIWDITLGGHVGLLRQGSSGNARPVGFQVSIEGSTQIRLDREAQEDLISTDYRFGVPFTWGNEVYQTKFGYYHISSHVGDEFLENNPGFTRLNFVRETLMWGHSLYLHPELRVYTEVGYAFLSNVSLPWEFQFGFDYSPACGTGRRGAPFVAMNYHIREELDYDGNIVGQAGWAWRRSPSSGLLRVGLEYYNGRDDQFSFYLNSQSKLGFGIWYDY